jgi:hypothetical protein
MRDPYDIPAAFIPRGMKYQWVTAEDDEAHTLLHMGQAGWTHVPFSRHADHFGGQHRGESGQIIVGHSILMERSAEAVEAAHQKHFRKAQKQLDDWAVRYGDFAGGVRMQFQNQDGVSKEYRVAIGDSALAKKITGLPTSLGEVRVEREAIPPPSQPKLASLLKRFIDWLFGKESPL